MSEGKEFDQYCWCCGASWTGIVERVWGKTAANYKRSVLETRKLLYFVTYFEEEFSNARLMGKVRFSGEFSGSVMFASALLDVVKSSVTGIEAARVGLRL